MKKKKRTEAQIMAFGAANNKCVSLVCLTIEASSRGIFVKRGFDIDEDDYYSSAWILDRLRKNDMNVAKKLIEFADTI